MEHQATERNPFLLMISPEIVLAAMERSERLGQLKRQLCRPLDRVSATGGSTEVAEEDSAAEIDPADTAN